VIIGISVGFYFWYAVSPRVIASNVFDQFEEAFYSDHPEEARALIDINTSFHKDFEKYYPLYKREFLYFEKGYKISNTRRSLNYIFGKNKVQTIWVFFSKVAKKDNKPRDYFEVLLTKENEVWKIRQYAFPDFIDYED